MVTRLPEICCKCSIFPRWNEDFGIEMNPTMIITVFVCLFAVVTKSMPNVTTICWSHREEIGTNSWSVDFVTLCYAYQVLGGLCLQAPKRLMYHTQKKSYQVTAEEQQKYLARGTTLKDDAACNSMCVRIDSNKTFLKNDALPHDADAKKHNACAQRCWWLLCRAVVMPHTWLVDCAITCRENSMEYKCACAARSKTRNCTVWANHLQLSCVAIIGKKNAERTVFVVPSSERTAYRMLKVVVLGILCHNIREPRALVTGKYKQKKEKYVDVSYQKFVCRWCFEPRDRVLGKTRAEKDFFLPTICWVNGMQGLYR